MLLAKIYEAQIRGTEEFKGRLPSLLVPLYAFWRNCRRNLI